MKNHIYVSIKEELINEIQLGLDKTQDFNKFSDLFSDDEGRRTLAEIRENLKRIQFYIGLDDIKDIIPQDGLPFKKPLFGKNGSLVSIRPCAEKYGNKTYLGFLLGEIAMSTSMQIDGQMLRFQWSQHNPAIFVPELGEIILGMESWWGEIKTTEDLKQITDQDIQDVWYVKLWKELEKKEAEKEADGTNRN